MGILPSNIAVLLVRTRLVCSQCGASGEGSCHCGAPYVPPGELAATAIATDPAKSDRAIAEEIGVSDTTVLRARRNSGASCEAPRRKGLDGKTYSAKPKRKEAAVPLNHQVNKMLDRLGNDVDDGCANLVRFLEAHPELEQEGRDAITRELQVTANKLLNVAQMIDGS